MFAHIPPADYINKIDTLEGKTIYLIIQFEKHPIDNKANFSIGKFLALFQIICCECFHSIYR